MPARNLRCPRCATVVTALQGRKPVCRKCGYGSEPESVEVVEDPDTEPAPWPTADTEPELTEAIIRPWRAREPPTAPVGRARSFAGVLWLSFITLGIYLLVYLYKVYGELDRQHGRRHHKALYWLSLIPGLGLVFAILYHAKEIPQMQGYREMRGMGPGLTRTTFFLWSILGALILIGPFVALYKLNKSARQLWFRIHAESGPGSGVKANAF